MKLSIQINTQEEIKTLSFIINQCLSGPDRMSGMLYDLCVKFELDSCEELKDHISSLKEDTYIRKVLAMYDSFQKFNADIDWGNAFRFYSEFWDKVEKGIKEKNSNLTNKEVTK